ncbi:MAG: GGDEF domain-containing protein [Candidatus Humimicrobiaceae bacterium]
MNLNLVKKITISTLTGGIIGYVIFHPVFMIIDDYYMHNDFDSFQNYLSYFSIDHLHMIIFFVIVGIIFGFLFGFLNYRISSLIKELHLHSITDELTQINNRRYLINELEKEIIRSKRFFRNLSLIILDIDKFKYNNDTHGHIFGDKIIKSIAKFLKETIRKTDFVARFGGDEFVIVMPETEKSLANVLAKRLQKNLTKYSFENQKLLIKNTVSIGIASFPDDAKNITELIHNADAALYKAKEEGGNRICNFNIQYKTTEKFKLDT